MWELWRPALRSRVLGGALPAPGPPDLRTVCCEGAAHSQRQPDRRRNHYRSWRTNTRCRGHLGPGRTWFPPLGAGGCYSAHIPCNLRRRHRLDETAQSPRSAATRPTTRLLARWLAQFTARTAGGCYGGRFGSRTGRLTTAWTCRGAAVGWRWAGTTGWRPVWFRERCRCPAGHAGPLGRCDSPLYGACREPKLRSSAAPPSSGCEAGRSTTLVARLLIRGVCR
jgi:hypothetical protein